MPDNRPAAPLMLAAALLAVACYAATRFHEALTPFVLAAAFAYVLNPLVTYFEAKGLRRLHLICIGYLAAGAILFALYISAKSFLADEATQLSSNAPVYLKNIQRLAAVLKASLAQKLPLPHDISSSALDSIISSGLDQLQNLPAQILGLLPLLLHGLLVPFIGFFFLLDASDGMENLIQATPSRFVEQAIHLIGEIDASLGGYLRGMLITAAAIGMVSFFGLVILEVENALAISALSGIFSVIPYMGAVMGLLVGGAMAWYQFGSVWAFVKVTVFFIGVRVADEIFLQPIISKHSVHLHPMVNLLVLMLGGEMFGFLGLVFAVPAACIAKSLFKVAWSWYASESGLELPPSSLCETIPYT